MPKHIEVKPEDKPEQKAVFYPYRQLCECVGQCECYLADPQRRCASPSVLDDLTDEQLGRLKKCSDQLNGESEAVGTTSSNDTLTPSARYKRRRSAVSIPTDPCSLSPAGSPRLVPGKVCGGVNKRSIRRKVMQNNWVSQM